ncbi:MAG TPA: helix-turn-helix domain-containing protein [Candidatus Saccharimonadales bacterium]|nr:helix-turn-helix domain-containing protein [Candidatus Saccharimonadales bacterium]
MRLEREYTYEGGPTLYKKRKKLKSIRWVKGNELDKITISEKWYLELCHEFRNARLAKRLTQKELAHDLLTTQAWISDLENGKHNLTIGSLLGVASHLRIKLTILAK